MRKISRFIFLLVMAVCVLGSFTYVGGGLLPCEAAVTIKGKALSQIGDIVSTVTGSEFPKIEKHSVLLYERYYASGNTVYTQPRVFTINSDGSKNKEYTLNALSTTASTFNPLPFQGIVQKMDLSISQRTLFYSIAGYYYSYSEQKYSQYGYRQILSDSKSNVFDGSNKVYETPYSRNTWGNCYLTVKGMEDREIFAYIHSSVMNVTGTMYLSLVPSSGTLSIQNGDSLGFKLFDYSSGIRAVDIAAGDFDGDGYKNDIVVAWNNNNGVYAYIYTVTRTNDNKLKVTRLLDNTVHSGTNWGEDFNHQASVAALAGDFDGDGVDEAAVVTKTHGSSIKDLRVKVYKRNKDSGSWSSDEITVVGDFQGIFKAAKADLNGDGQDEIVLLFFAESWGTVYPRLEYWSFKAGSIKPIRNSQYNRGGVNNTNVLGYSLTVSGNGYNEYYKTAEDFCITAGPITGTIGHIKLADDIAISHVNSEASRVFVVPTKLDSSRNFAGFGDTKKIYEFIGNNSARRGAIITADFANEGLVLEKPIRTRDDSDHTFLAVLQALPYHVDNVDVSGNLTSNPVNYTFSGFTGDGGSGKMSVTYTKGSSSSQEKDVSFNMSSTTETIALLGDAGKTVHTGLGFLSTAANLAGKVSEKAASVGTALSKVMEFVTDKIDETTTKATNYAIKVSTTSSITARQMDETSSYSAQQYIWRYKIREPIPSWYTLGRKADYSSGGLNAQSQSRYLTFSMYDSAVRNSTPSNQNSYYQPTHEEGNFFSYPSDYQASEGYNPNDTFGEPVKLTWAKGNEAAETIQLTESSTESTKTEDEIKPSTLTKTVSAIWTFFGADDPNPLPPYTSHTEHFSKTFSTSEKVDVVLDGRGSVPGEEARHTIHVASSKAREGTLNVTTAVELDMSGRSRLWGSSSRYSKFADPSLLLPNKFRRNGGSFVTNDNNADAMNIRGMRFYVPELDLLSDTEFLAGLTYTIRVPLYNASFKDTGNFDVRLSYVPANDFDIESPHKSMNALKEIQTLRNVSLGGWENAYSDNNKGWAEFTWKVPANTKSGNYRFVVQIDPEGKLQEVHESRLDSAGNIVDAGGNNDGYFDFIITSPEDAIRKRRLNVSGSAVRAANAPSDGILLRSIYPGKQSRANSESVRSAFMIGDISDTITADLKLDVFESDEDNISFYILLGLFSEGLGISEDASLPITCTLTYDGDEYYPEAYLLGVNLKEGALDLWTEEGSLDILPEKMENINIADSMEDTFLLQRISLVPHETSKFVIHMTPRKIDWRHGAMFAIKVPELLAPAMTDDEETDTGKDTGTDTQEVSNPGSPGGGCGVFTGSILLFGLACLVFRKR